MLLVCLLASNSNEKKVNLCEFEKVLLESVLAVIFVVAKIVIGVIVTTYLYVTWQTNLNLV